MTKDKSRIQSCVDHINTAVDVDPWAKELVAEMGKEILKYAKDINVPINDAISRQAVIDGVKTLHDVAWKNWHEPTLSVNVVLDMIRELPPAQPEPQWIPCSETVDIPDHEIMACDKYGEEMFGYLAYEDDQWLCESDDCMMYDPIAWREKPEPYREEGVE